MSILLIRIKYASPKLCESFCIIQSYYHLHSLDHLPLKNVRIYLNFQIQNNEIINILFQNIVFKYYA